MNIKTNEQSRVAKTLKELQKVQTPEEWAAELDETFRQAARDGSLYE